MYKDTGLTRDDLELLPENDRTLALFDAYFKQEEVLDLPTHRTTYWIEVDTTNILEPNISFRTVLDFSSYKKAKKYIYKNILVGGDEVYLYNRDKSSLMSKKEVEFVLEKSKGESVLLKQGIILPIDNWIYSE